MKYHVKIYLDFHNLHGEFIACLVCGAEAVDLHHIYPKGMGGTAGKDVIENLIALCRLCHEKAHKYIFTKEYLLKIVQDYING